jgi:hypothetical protein
MRMSRALFVLACFLPGISTASAQAPKVEPRITTRREFRERVTTVEVAPRFITAIRLPETVNSVVVGDPSVFQVEHSEREPRLVFVKSLSTKPAESNLLISTVGGREFSLLLVSRGDRGSSDPLPADFLLKYEISGGFFIAPSPSPSTLVAATVPLEPAGSPEGEKSGPSRKPGDGAGADVSFFGDAPLQAHSAPAPEEIRNGGMERLIEAQERAPLPTLYGLRAGGQADSEDHVRAGVSRVIDAGQQVIVLFSVVNPTKHAILLMPPQVQLGGKTTSGRLIRRATWTTAEQLPVLDFRLSRRRLGPAERADGVLVFERPPYKQSSETLLLQVAESGAVDRPALAPIGFGVSTGAGGPQ